MNQTEYETQDSSFNEGFKRQQSRLSSVDASEGSDFVEGKSEVKINEYQAAWNVTNAIQVRHFFHYFFCRRIFFDFFLLFLLRCLDLQERFSYKTLDVFSYQFSFLKNIIKDSSAENDKNIKFLLDHFESLLDIDESIASSFLRDKLREKQIYKKEQHDPEQLSIAALDILTTCDKDAFSLIDQFVVVLAKLQVTNASADRSSSSFRYLKTYLRSTLTKTGFSVLTRFAKTGRQKRLEFDI